MSNTALHSASPSPMPRGVPGQYLGTETILHFGDPIAELSALRQSCGLFPLSWRAKIAVTGKDRVRWLHNMVTNNVRDLPSNRGNYNFVLNAQGRILGDIYIFNRGESLIIDTDLIQVEPLLTAMKRYIIMDKVEMNIVPIVALGVCGPAAEEKLPTAGFDVKGIEPLEVRELRPGNLVVRGPVNKPNWYEAWFNVEEGSGIAGGQMIGTQALEWWRILHGIPQYGQDIRDRDLPQETGQTQALNFNKGCYIGQEIVERIRSRGQVHRKFIGFEFEDDVPALGKYDSAGRTLAEVTSLAAVPSNAGVRNIGLGYVRREALEPSPEIDLNGGKAKVVDLPFAE